jgi:hypothetical protein
MFRNAIVRALASAMVCVSAYSCAWAQGELKLLQIIHLPVSASRGSFNHFPYSEMTAREHFSMRVAPDQSILVFDSDASGHWPLVRITKWWTPTPVSEVLNLPGWTFADAKNLDSINVDVQITPDGRYAVASAGAFWLDKSGFLFHAPIGYVQRKPDTIITLIDLAQWKIVDTIHTTTVANESLEGVRIANDHWLVLDFSLGASPLQHLLYRFDTRLFSLHDLRPGPQCISDRPFRTGVSSLKSNADPKPIEEHNDTACHDVLQATARSSVQTLETFIYRDQDVLPPAVLQSSDGLQRTEDDFFRGWGEFPYFLFYAENPPFESSSRTWYGLYNVHDSHLYDLTIFEADGHKQKTQTISNQMCGDPTLEQQGSACGCRVVDVSEPQHTLLARCRTQRGDYDGMVRRVWLSVLHTNDLSAAGFILPHKNAETLHAIATGDSHPYVVTLESGDPLSVYAIPEPR